MDPETLCTVSTNFLTVFFSFLKMTFPRRMRCEGWPTYALHAFTTSHQPNMLNCYVLDLRIIHALTLDNKWLSHIQNTIVRPKIWERGHNCDRTSRKQGTEKYTTNPNNTVRPLFHNCFCISLVGSLLLLCSAGHRSHRVKKTTRPPVTEGHRNPGN